MKWQDELALGRPTLEEGGCIVNSLFTWTCFRNTLGGGCISSAQSPYVQSSIWLCTPARAFFVGKYVLSHCRYLSALTQSVGRGEDMIHRQKKAGVRGQRNNNWLVLNAVTVMQVEAHVTYDFTRSLCCLEWNGIQSQFVSTISKFAPGFLIPCLLGRGA